MTAVLVYSPEASEATRSSGAVWVITTSSVESRCFGMSVRSRGRSVGVAGIAGSTQRIVASRCSCAVLAISCQVGLLMVALESANSIGSVVSTTRNNDGSSSQLTGPMQGCTHKVTKVQWSYQGAKSGCLTCSNGPLDLAGQPRRNFDPTSLPRMGIMDRNMPQTFVVSLRLESLKLQDLVHGKTING